MTVDATEGRRLHVLNLRTATAEDYAGFFKSPTGRDVTPAGLEEFRRLVGCPRKETKDAAARDRAH